MDLDWITQDTLKQLLNSLNPDLEKIRSLNSKKFTFKDFTLNRIMSFDDIEINKYYFFRSTLGENGYDPNDLFIIKTIRKSEPTARSPAKIHAVTYGVTSPDIVTNEYIPWVLGRAIPFDFQTASFGFYRFYTISMENIVKLLRKRGREEAWARRANAVKAFTALQMPNMYESIIKNESINGGRRKTMKGRRKQLRRRTVRNS